MEYVKEPIEDFFYRVKNSDFYNLPIGRVLKYLPECHKSGPWICGGAIRRAVEGPQPLNWGDIDYFCKTEQQAEYVRNYITHHLPKDWKINIKCVTNNAVTYDIRPHHKTLHIPVRFFEVQVITRSFYDSVQDALSDFHYTICQFGYDGRNIICNGEALWDLRMRTLSPVEGALENRGPGSLWRGILKYVPQGFEVDEAFRKRIESLIRKKTDNNLPVDYYDDDILANWIEEYLNWLDFVPEKETDVNNNQIPAPVF